MISSSPRHRRGNGVTLLVVFKIFVKHSFPPEILLLWIDFKQQHSRTGSGHYYNAGATSAQAEHVSSGKNSQRRLFLAVAILSFLLRLRVGQHACRCRDAFADLVDILEAGSKS